MSFKRGFNFSNGEAVIVNKDTNGRTWKVDLGSTPFLRAKGNIPWINYYGIDLKETKNLTNDLDNRLGLNLSFISF